MAVGISLGQFTLFVHHIINQDLAVFNMEFVQILSVYNFYTASVM